MPERILIVDDEPPVREALTLYLTRRGYAVCAVESSPGLFQVLENGGADLLILDVELENVNGLDVLEHVKGAYPSLPVIILTGRGYEEPLLQRAGQNRAEGYVSKTLSPSELLMTVKRVLKTHARPAFAQ